MASRGFVVSALVVAICAPLAAAQSQDEVLGITLGNSRSHVRPASTYIGTVLTKATQDSPTIVALVNRIGASNVIAHVECGHFASLILEGRTVFVTATHNVRYVRVQVDCRLLRDELIAIIGHELQHVVEIVAAPEVLDEASFAQMLHTKGHSTCCSLQEQYETTAALSVGDRVMREVLSRRPFGGNE